MLIEALCLLLIALVLAGIYQSTPSTKLTDGKAYIAALDVEPGVEEDKPVKAEVAAIAEASQTPKKADAFKVVVSDIKIVADIEPLSSVCCDDMVFGDFTGVLSTKPNEIYVYADVVVERPTIPVATEAAEVVPEELVADLAVIIEEHKRVMRKGDATLKAAHFRRYAGLVAWEIRAKMGPAPKVTEANRLVAWELGAKVLAQRNMRKCDMLRYLTLATDMVFIPTKFDVEAYGLRSSAPVARRLLEVQPEPENYVRKIAKAALPWWFGRDLAGLRYRSV